MRLINARYAGKCKGCATSIHSGATVAHLGRGQTYCLACAASIDDGRTDVVTIYFPTTGKTMVRNRAGCCIDAPCCGCCS